MNSMITGRHFMEVKRCCCVCHINIAPFDKEVIRVAGKDYHYACRIKEVKKMRR